MSALTDLPPILGEPRFWAVVAGLTLLLVVARKVPVLRGLLSLVTTVALVGMLVLIVSERSRFDPYLDGLTSRLNLSEQQVVGEELKVRMARDGHFYVRATIDGIERRMLVDSGATITALASDTAASAGLTVRQGMTPIVLRTANGLVRAGGAEVSELRLGNIVARDLDVVVSPAFGEANILGMNFLSKLKSWRVEGKTLVLVPHHPQPVA